MKRLILVLAGVALAVPALADTTARPGQMDPRIKTFVYSEHTVYIVEGHYGYQTLIRFAPDEAIQNISIGDSIAWQIVPNNAGNKLFLKPIEENAQTNLNVVTDARIYSFELRASQARGPADSDIAYRLEFSYPEEELRLLLDREEKAQRDRDSLVGADREGVTPAAWNFDYTFAGDRELVPKRIFDDGQFTYFEFAAKTDTPAIFLVNADQTEALVNHHVDGNYVVVQRVGRQFTLRDGNVVTCIYNETYSRTPDLDLNSPRPEDSDAPAATSQAPIPPTEGRRS